MIPVPRLLSFTTALALGALALPAQAQHAGHGASGLAAQAPAGPGVYELASDGKGSLFVAFAGSRDKPGGGLITYDAATLKEKKRVELGASAPYGMGINTRTGILYTTNTRAGKSRPSRRPPARSSRRSPTRPKPTPTSSASWSTKRRTPCTPR